MSRPTATSKQVIVTPVATGILQRACACGERTIGGGDCPSCQKKREGEILQRSAKNHDSIEEAPPIVSEVLRSSGEPMAETTRAFFEPRFGHEFSNVRVHADAKAAESAQAVNALAYTVGNHIVFGAGQYSAQSQSGRQLLGHELTHVLQQERAGKNPQAKLPVGQSQDAAETEAEEISAKIMEAEVSSSTIEPQAHSGAPVLRRRNIFEEFAGLFEGDNFNDKELQDYLNFLDEKGAIENHSNSDNKARAIVNIWQSGDSRFHLTTNRKLLLIKEMLSGSTGDDDEQAILEIMERSKKEELNQLFGTGGLSVKELNSAFDGEEFDRLRDFYERRFEGGSAEMLKGNIQAVGESLALGAQRATPSQYELKLQEAYQKLTGINFGPTGGLSLEHYCMPESKDTSSGTKTTYWYDKDFWEPDIDEFPNEQNKKACKLKVRSSVSPSAAIDALFNQQGKWQVDCAQFVQIFHLYALRHTLGSEKFDAKFQDDMRLELRRRQSSGVATKVLFQRTSGASQMMRSTDGQSEPKGINQLLAEAPIGSRVRWTNTDKKALGQAFENENSVKMGADKYAAHPLFKVSFFVSNFPWLVGKDYLLSRHEIEMELAKETNSNAGDSYIQTHIFISEIEYFKDPTKENQ